MLRRYTAPHDAEKVAHAHASFSPADRLKGRLRGGNGPWGTPDLPEGYLKLP